VPGPGPRREESPRGEEASRRGSVSATRDQARGRNFQPRRSLRDRRLRELKKTRAHQFRDPMTSDSRRAKSPRGEEARAAGARARLGTRLAVEPLRRAASRCAGRRRSRASGSDGAYARAVRAATRRRRSLRLPPAARPTERRRSCGCRSRQERHPEVQKAVRFGARSVYGFGRYSGGIGLSGRSVSQATEAIHQRLPSRRSWIALTPRSKGFGSEAAWRDS